MRAVSIFYIDTNSFKGTLPPRGRGLQRHRSRHQQAVARSGGYPGSHRAPDSTVPWRQKYYHIAVTSRRGL
eukprot:2620795-Amphidinium_carterae.1